MQRGQSWLGQWGHFLSGVAIGLLIVTPAFAMPPDLPVDFRGDAQFYTLIGSGLLLVAALVFRAMRGAPADADADAPQRYGTRYFPDDRPIALE